MKDYTLSELTQIIKDSFATYEGQGTHKWTWESAARDLSYQVGSLTKVILQLSGDRYAHGKSQEALEREFRDELADILAEVLFIAHERGIDMGQAINEMVEVDLKKAQQRSK